MWIIPVALLVLVVLWITGMNLDERFFGGRFLVRTKTNKLEFKKSLEAVLSQKDRSFVEWESSPADWINDKMNIPIQDRELDHMRARIVLALQSCEQKLNREAIAEIEQALREIGSA